MSPTSPKNSTQMENMKFCSLTHCIAENSKLRLSNFILGHLGGWGRGRGRCFRALGMGIGSLSNHDGDAEDNVDKNSFFNVPTNLTVL